MNKKLYPALFLICLTAIISLCGCESNRISLYMGISETPENNVKLELNTPVKIEQSKEKIEDSKLVFNANDEDIFDNMNICFSGNNIKNVVMTSENKTILYDHYDTISCRMDYFEFYYYIDTSDIDDNFKPDLDLSSKWDNGQFDDIKNVYFNGMSIYDISRTRRDPKKEIGFVSVHLYTEDTLSYSNEYYYLDEMHKIDKPVIVTSILTVASNDKKLPEEYRKELIQGKSVQSNNNVEQDGFIYRYELLFYNSQQAALKEKTSFDYSDLQGETVEIKVTYNDDSTEDYCIDISFDESGNIVAALR